MRLATTRTGGKIQRTTDGLPIGFCLASKNDLLAKAAAAHKEWLAGHCVQVAARVSVTAVEDGSNDDASGASDGRVGDAGGVISLAAVDVPGEPGSVVVGEPRDSSAGVGAMGLAGEQHRVASGPSGSSGDQQRVAPLEQLKTHWITYLEKVEADCVADVKELAACGWYIRHVSWMSTGFDVACIDLEGKIQKCFFPESKYIGEDLKRVETPAAPPDRTLGAASAAEAERASGSGAAGVAGNVVGPPRNSGRAPSRRLKLATGKAHQITPYYQHYHSSSHYYYYYPS